MRCTSVQGRLAPLITVGLRLDETWYPIGVYVDSGAAHTLLHADMARGAGFAYRAGPLISLQVGDGSCIEASVKPHLFRASRSLTGHIDSLFNRLHMNNGVRSTWPAFTSGTREGGKPRDKSSATPSHNRG